jgi:polysaccharide deacetylase family protein (PEP-CTERM system associated)
MISNVLSVDVEDYFHVEAFSDIVDRNTWDSYPSRVENNTRRVLDLFDESSVKGTFFILGWVAERFPQLVREIVQRGHEPACHSYWHRPIFRLKPEEFREDTLRAKNCIEQIAGEAVYGYRAPSFSVTADSLWGLDILAEAGFTYDSSIFPIHHDVYGIPTAPRAPFTVDTAAGPLLEYPVTTFHFLGPNLPVGGGGYLRMLPYWYTRLGAARARAESLPLIVYLHPWEVDPEQPVLPGRWKSRLRHYTNLNKTADRLRKLLRSAPFASFRESGLAAGARPAELKIA